MGRAIQGISNNVVFNPTPSPGDLTPSPGDLIDLALGYSDRFPRDKIGWSELGPELLSAIEGIYHGHGYRIMPPEFANPVDYWEFPSALLARRTKFAKRHGVFASVQSDVA
jgi:hypothetical protein